MPVPFRDLRDSTVPGLAAFLTFVDEPVGSAVRGALFVVNSLGEPVEFAFARTEFFAPFLWRSQGARQNAIAELTSALFGTVSSAPVLILGRSDEVTAGLFQERVVTGLPVAIVSTPSAEDGMAPPADVATVIGNLVWPGEIPTGNSPAHHLLAKLVSSRLLLEPFDRAKIGIEEAFGA